jgi:hypothetical protein
VERNPLELLILLASREGQLVTRSEIADRLWASEVFVDTEYGIKRADQWGGYRARLPWLLHQLQIKSKSQFVSPFEQALLYAQLGNQEQTSSSESGFRSDPETRGPTEWLREMAANRG